MLILKRNYFLLHDKKKYRCSVGRNGIRRGKKEGDMCTPTGTFGLGPIYIRKDKITKLKTKIQTFPIFKNMYWEDDPTSKNYNKLSFNSKYSGECLYRKDNIYDIIIIIKYNFHKVIPNKGSAIFIHVAEKKFAPTKGCIALKKEDLIQIINNLTKDEKILISF